MTIAWVAVTILADGFAGLAGGLLSERWLERHQPGLVAFAAGAMLAAVFLDVLPEAADQLPKSAFTWAFAGFLALAAIEALLGQHHHGERDATPWLGPALLASDALHNLGDGAAVAAAFLADPHVGLGVALAVVAHEVPQEIGDYALLRRAGYPRGRALALLAAVQLTSALGAAVVLAAAPLRSWVPVVLAVASGTFLYIGATDLLPELHRAPARARTLGLAAGVAVVAAASLLGA